MSSKHTLATFLKEKKTNSVTKISASYILNFKQCFVQIEKIDGTMDGFILKRTKDGYLNDFNNFLFNFIKKNKLSSSFNLTIDTHLSKNTILQDKMNKFKIEILNFRTKKELKTFNELSTRFINNERETLLTELNDYKNNIMIYTDGSQKGEKCGMACIIDNNNSEQKINLTKTMRTDNLDYINFEINAITLGLEYIIKENLNANSTKKIIITIDSDIANDVCLNIKTKQYFQQKYINLYNLMNLINFNFDINLIKSHVTHLCNKKNKDFYYNDLADKLANEAASLK